MNEILLATIPALPFVLAFVSLSIRNPLPLALAPAAALLIALMVPTGQQVEIPWLLLGSYWQLDETAKLFLLFSSVIWLVATIYMIRETPEHPSPRIYRCFFMFAMAGNLLLIVAADMVSFYLGFAMMGLASYVLMLKTSQISRRAARVYLGFTLVGELALFTGIIVLFDAVGSTEFSELAGQTYPELAIGLLVLGFGIKLALPGLHPWLPLAYTAAPLITVAVLSGPMMKAGLLGWLRFLAPAANSMEFWGEVLLWLGMLGVFLGFVLAMTQREPKAVLAYSSVSKMGFVSAMFGYGLLNPVQKELILAALSLFAMHHLLIKPMLFIGLGDYQKRQANRLQLFGLVVLALSLMAAPFSGGSLVKMELSTAISGKLSVFLILVGLASVSMMFHFLHLVKQSPLVKPNHQEQRRLLTHNFIWWLLLPVAWWGPFMPNESSFDLKSMLVLLIGLVIYILFNKWFVRALRPARWTKPGDIYHLIEPLRMRWPVFAKTQHKKPAFFTMPLYFSASKQPEDSLSLAVKGLLWLLLIALLLIAVM